MAKRSLFANYGATEEEAGVRELEVNLDSLTDTTPKPKPIADKTYSAQSSIVFKETPKEEFDKPTEKPKPIPLRKELGKNDTQLEANSKENEVEPPRRGRPVVNPDVKMVSRTYMVAEPALEAMEEVFFQNRKKWSKGMSFSKYISNLIWQDTHNGQQLFDPETGDYTGL